MIGFFESSGSSQLLSEEPESHKAKVDALCIENGIDEKYAEALRSQPVECQMLVVAQAPGGRRGHKSAVGATRSLHHLHQHTTSLPFPEPGATMGTATIATVLNAMSLHVVSVADTDTHRTQSIKFRQNSSRRRRQHTTVY